MNKDQYVLAEKLLKDLARVNKYSECPNCKSEIKKNHIICVKCGQELGNKLTYEENLDYIRDYLHDNMYTQTEIIHKLGQEVKRLKVIVKNLKLKSGYEICYRCKGTGTVVVSPALDMKLECSKCKGEGIIETKE